MVRYELHKFYTACPPIQSTDPIAFNMYTRVFNKAEHIWTLSITPAGDSGWQIKDERDSEVVRSVTCTDWHRVERARMAFARLAEILREDGWSEAPH